MIIYSISIFMWSIFGWWTGIWVSLCLCIGWYMFFVKTTKNNIDQSVTTYKDIGLQKESSKQTLLWLEEHMDTSSSHTWAYHMLRLLMIDKCLSHKDKQWLSIYDEVYLVSFAENTLDLPIWHREKLLAKFFALQGRQIS